MAVSSIDFRHAQWLIDIARESSARWIDGGGLSRAHPEQELSLHEHRLS
jgi:hypothetical protein